MTEQGALIKFMIEYELKRNENELISISNHEFFNPKEIKVEADEIAFISFVKIYASSDFIFKYSSATESRKIEKTITILTLIESNIVTKHLSTIKLNISNNDDYQVSVVKLKFIK